MTNILNIAPLYMTIFTVYSFFIPFFLLYSIAQARKERIKKHITSQTIFLGLTLLFVIYFEIMVRVRGGFFEYVDDSILSYDFLIIYLFIHIAIASLSFGGWIYIYVSSLRTYTEKSKNNFDKKIHKRIGISIFIALTINSIMGILLYFFLFFRN